MAYLPLDWSWYSDRPCCGMISVFGPYSIEWIAATAGAVSVYLSARENIWTWPTAILNVALYLFIFYESGLYSDMGLQVVYLVLSIYGWYSWLHRGDPRSDLHVSHATW